MSQVVCKCYATVMNLHPAVSMINVFALWKESSNYSHPLQLWAAVTVTPYSTAFEKSVFRWKDLTLPIQIPHHT